jgi:iron complex outermembrane recepter protein
MLNSTRTTASRGSLLMALLLAGLPLGALHADEEAAATGAAPPAAAVPAGGEAGERSLQEVIVTATRREESLSKVPISVSALTQSDMDDRGIKDMQDIVRFVPGVTIDNSGTNAISIRGISSSAGAGTTGIYIDDTPIQMRSVGFNPDDTLPKTFDLDRVEVLRGPQGTLFGSGSEGGTVRYILTQPSLTSESTYVRSEASYTEYGQPSYELGVAHGGPLVDGVFGWRASAWYRYDGGWIDRVDPTTDATIAHNVNYSHTLVLRLAGLWQPVSGFTATPSILYQNRQEHDQPTYWPAYSNPGSGQFDTATPERIPDPDQYVLPALKLQWDLAKSSIISNTSYYHRKELTGYQGTVYDLAFYQSLGWPNNPLTGGLGCGVAPPANPPCAWYPLLDASGLHLPAGFDGYSTPNVMTNAQDSYVQELRWQSSDPDEKLHWTVGAFWQLAKESSTEELKDPNIDSLFNYLYGVPATQLFTYTDVNGNTISPYACNGAGTYTAIPQCDIYYNSSTTYDKQFALYGELNYALTQRLRLTLGERFSHSTFAIRNYADGLENYGPTPVLVNGMEEQLQGVPRTASTSSNPSTPKASLAFQADPNNMYYATYARGYRVGGGNPELPSYCSTDLATAGFPNGAPTIYRPDTTDDYEIGAKNAFGGVLRVATSVYYIKWNNIQQSVYIAGSCGLQFTDNLGQAVAKGFDLQAELAAGPLFVDLAVGYTDARYTANAVPPAPGAPPLALNGDAISGQAATDYAPGTNPPWTVSIGPEYRFTIGQHDAFIRLDYTYESRNPWLAAVQDPASSQYIPASYTLPATNFVSLRAGINVGDWQIAPFIDNLLNSHTVTNFALGQLDPYNPAGSPSQQQNAYTYRPFTVGITATWHGH